MTAREHRRWSLAAWCARRDRRDALRRRLLGISTITFQPTMPTPMAAREALLAEFSDVECDLLFLPGNVPQERLDEMMQLVMTDIPAARVALRTELARLEAEAGKELPTRHPPPLHNPIPL